MPSVRIPQSDFIAAIAETTGLTQADVQKVISAIGPTIADFFKKTGLQTLEIGGFIVLEEVRKKGTLAKELGGMKYDVPVILSRISDTIKEAIKIKSNKALIGGGQELLSDEEYEAALADEEGELEAA